MLELLHVVDEVEAGTLPRRRPSVVVNIVYTAMWIKATFPPMRHITSYPLHCQQYKLAKGQLHQTRLNRLLTNL